jgi:hypothetical protein
VPAGFAVLRDRPLIGIFGLFASSDLLRFASALRDFSTIAIPDNPFQAMLLEPGAKGKRRQSPRYNREER